MLKQKIAARYLHKKTTFARPKVSSSLNKYSMEVVNEKKLGVNSPRNAPTAIWCVFHHLLSFLCQIYARLTTITDFFFVFSLSHSLFPFCRPSHWLFSLPIIDLYIYFLVSHIHWIIDAFTINSTIILLSLLTPSRARLHDFSDTIQKSSFCVCICVWGIV
jgi:hypothetical protein